MSSQPLPNQGRLRQPGTYAAPTLTFDLAAELRSLEAEEPWQAAHTAKTLVKHADLRIVLVALRAGGCLQQHETAGRVSIHTLSGNLRLRIPDGDICLPAGNLVALDCDVPHEVSALADSAFLLTIAWPALGGTGLELGASRHESARAKSSRQPTKVIRWDEGRLSRERGLDKTLADTFPCSDALSSIPDPYLRGA